MVRAWWEQRRRCAVSSPDGKSSREGRTHLIGVVRDFRFAKMLRGKSNSVGSAKAGEVRNLNAFAYTCGIGAEETAKYVTPTSGYYN